MNYYEHHIGDYAAATVHLSLLEHGIYTRLLQIYYLREGPIPADQVMRLVGARDDSERAAVRDVLNEFFILAGDVYRNKRCDEEIAKYADKRGKAQASAAKRWESERNANAVPTHIERIANAVPTQSEGNALQSPVTSHQINPPTPRKREGEPEGFAEFWSAYPRKTAKPNAERAWRRLSPSAELRETMLRALRAQCGSEQWQRDGGQYIPHPATWLNGRRWEDHIEAPQVDKPPVDNTARAVLRDLEEARRAAQSPEAQEARKRVMQAIKGVA